jgi:putative transposase
MPKRAPQRTEIPDDLLDQLLEHAESTADLAGPNGLLRQLTGRLVERALQTELTEHLGYEKNEARTGENARNGGTPKTLRTEAGDVQVQIPRDRDGSFEPQLVKKHQRRMESFDDRILALYGRGMTVREIQGFFKDAYDADVSPTLISTVTDQVLVDVEEWRQRRLDPLYPIVYLDGLVVKVKVEGTVQKRTVYIALGVNMEGRKEVLGLWMSGTEGAKFWLHVITELKNRGIEDMLIVCCDGLKGFPEAIEAVFPLAIVQTCIVHMIRNSLRLVAWGNRRAVAKDLKPVYRAATVEEATRALEAFDEAWGKSYPSITRSWRDNWERLSPFFAFPDDIRRAIYTTNAIEALNRQLRKALKPKGHFPSEESVMKVLFLALRNAATKWTMPIQRWDLALQQFAIHFEGRITL